MFKQNRLNYIHISAVLQKLLNTNFVLLIN